MPTITCARCGQTGDQLPFRPFQNDLGLRAFEQICQNCWAEWLKTQQQLINHYGLNVRDAKAKEMLFSQMEQFLFKAKAAAE
jgi:Fe-S cluster biosynthesis and repair protein YggX